MAMAMETAAPTPTVTTAKKMLFSCQPLCAKPYIRAATVAITNDLSSSLLRQTTATATAKGFSTHTAAMMSSAIPPAPTAATAAATTATTAATPTAVQVPSRINIKSSSLPNTKLTTTTQTTAPLVLAAPLPLPTPTTDRSVIPTAPARPTPAVSASSTSFVPYRTYAYQQQVPAASAVILPTVTAPARMHMNSATTTFRNPTTQQRLTLWKQQQLIQQQQQQVQRLAQQQQQQQVQLQRAQQQQQRTQQQQQRQQQGIYHSDDDESHRRTTGTRRRCPLSQPPQLPTTILK